MTPSPHTDVPSFAGDHDWSAAGYARRFGHLRTDGRGRALSRLAARAGETVLDLACGPGVLTARLVDAVGPDGRVHAVDRSPRMVALTADATRGRHNIAVHAADMARTGLATGTCDAVLCAHALHFAEDLPATATEIRRVLRPGGRVVASIARDASPRGAAATLADHLAATLGRPEVTTRWQQTHDTVADDSRLVALLGTAGLTTSDLEIGDDVVVHQEPADLVRATVAWWGWARALRSRDPEKARAVVAEALRLTHEAWDGPLEVHTPWVLVRAVA